MYDFFKSYSLFKGLNKEELESLDFKYHIKKYDKGEFIAFKGDLIDSFMLVKEGEIIAEMQKINGKVVRVEKLNKTREIAPAFVFGNNTNFPVDIHASTYTEVIYISKNDLLLLLQSNKKILENILNSFSNKTQFLSQRLWFANKTIEEKLASYLIENCKGDIVNLNLSIKELAELFGVSRPSLSRVIVSWVEEGFLERISNKSFRIVNKDLLLDKI